MIEINLKIITTRLDNRTFQVVTDDGEKKDERLFNDATSIYASHVALRDYISECEPGTRLHVHTNSNGLIIDIKEAKAGVGELKVLQRILKRTAYITGVELGNAQFTK